MEALFAEYLDKLVRGSRDVAHSCGPRARNGDEKAVGLHALDDPRESVTPAQERRFRLFISAQKHWHRHQAEERRNERKRGHKLLDGFDADGPGGAFGTHVRLVVGKRSMVLELGVFMCVFSPPIWLFFFFFFLLPHMLERQLDALGCFVDINHAACHQHAGAEVVLELFDKVVREVCNLDTCHHLATLQKEQQEKKEKKRKEKRCKGRVGGTQS